MQDHSTAQSHPARQRLVRLTSVWGLAGALTLGSVTLAAAAVDPASARSLSLPASRLFHGDQLSERAKASLSDLIRGLQGTSIEVAVVVPTGPWSTERAGRGERDLNAARIGALRAFLADSGIEAGRVFMESGLDSGLQEPRLDVQLMPRISR